MLNILGKLVPLVNPAMIAGLLANNTSDEIVTQVLGINDTSMLLVILLISGYKLGKIGLDKLKGTP
ncbi:MAG: hypothetical protein OXR68_00275 [Alphaproteobacteria bacterium]|nr:hypothetical protein [Alphaproteobacteria bacterium]MDD9919047.1 hypothetical protein [Alphaproteobacteria bacterium]